MTAAERAPGRVAERAGEAAGPDAARAGRLLELAVADLALIAPIYAAREKPIEGITARMIADAGAGIEFLDRSNVEIVNELRRRLQPNDIFITMGAGDVHEVAEALVRGMGEVA